MREGQNAQGLFFNRRDYDSIWGLEYTAEAAEEAELLSRIDAERTALWRLSELAFGGGSGSTDGQQQAPPREISLRISRDGEVCRAFAKAMAGRSCSAGTSSPQIETVDVVAVLSN